MTAPVGEADFSIKAFDRLPSIQAQLAVADVPLDLSTAVSVSFIMRAADGGAVKVNAPASIIDAATGVVRYDWQATDTDVPGAYEAEWEVLWPSARTQSFPTLTYHSVHVLADLDGAA